MRSNKSKSMTKCAASAVLFGGTLAAAPALASGGGLQTINLDNFSTNASAASHAISIYDSNTQQWVGQQSVYALGNSPWGTAYRESNFGSGRAGTREVFNDSRTQAAFVNPSSFSIDAYYDGTGFSGFTDYELKSGSIAGSGVSGGKFGVKMSAPAPSAGYTVNGGAGVNMMVGTQYTFNSALDLTGGKVSITGSGNMTDRVGQQWQAKGNGPLVSSEVINLHQTSGFTVLSNGEPADTFASNYLNAQPSYMYLQVVLLSGLGVDQYGGTFQQRATVDLAFLGTQSLGNMEFSMSDFMLNNSMGTFDFTNVQAMQFTFRVVSGNGTSVDWDISSFSVSAVPAPGAAALLGLAGFVGRRRKA